ncbi:HxsD-like protein [bacterium]|nr:HxsD-like protein [bacterium]
MICVNFNKKLYNKKAIEGAIQIYKDWADFKISDLKKEIKVCLEMKIGNDEEYLKNEFCNYVLVLTGDVKVNVL